MVQNLGAELMTACGEPDRPVIKKSIDEVMRTINQSTEPGKSLIRQGFFYFQIRVLISYQFVLDSR